MFYLLKMYEGIFPTALKKNICLLKELLFDGDYNKRH